VLTTKKINIEQLQTDAKKYITNINNVQSTLDAGSLSDSKKFHPEDRVSQVVQRSMKEARRKAEQMQLYLDEMNRVYDDILTFFGDDNKDDGARRDFFSKLANFVTEYKKSTEKNLILEETWRRNEANMRRKQLTAQSANPAATNGDAPLSPSPSSGAMDSLLEKLRAAAPQTRDTRDRRRRARLKDRHQVRVASGQQIPETGENVDGDSGLLSPATEGGDSETTSERPSTADGLSEKKAAPGAGSVSEGEDIADRAASLLQGLRGDEGDGGVGSVGRDDSLRVRRRRESADDERQRRRAARRRAGTSSVDADAQAQGTIAEEAEGDASAPPDDLTITSTSNGGAADDADKPDGDDESKLPTPTTVVVPPSPTQSESKMSVQRDGSDD
jgi:cytokinesis protein